MAPSSLHHDPSSSHDNSGAGGGGSNGGGGGGEVDVRDVATDSQKLALAMSSDTPDARYTVRRLLSDHAPMVKPLHLTLLAITAKLELVKSRKEELVALTKMCTFLTAAYVIVMSHQREQQQEQHHEEEKKLNGGSVATPSTKSSDGRSVRSSRSSSSRSSSSISSISSRKVMRLLDLSPLEECVEALAALVERKGKRRKSLMRISENSGKNEIVDLNARVSDLARDMGLAGIVAVFKGVLDDTGAGGYGSHSDGGDILTPQEVNLARQPKPTVERAHVPCLVPPREGWHVRRDRVINAVLESLLSNRGRCSDRGGGNGRSNAKGEGREGAPCIARPRVVGLVGESGSGKTSVAAEIVRSPEVLEYFSDGVVWLPVNRGDGEEDRLQALMCWLARLVREEIGTRHDCGGEGGGGSAASGGGGGGGGASGGFFASGTPAASSSGLARNSEDGAARVKSFVGGGEIHGGVRRRRQLRCLVVADNVCEADVVAKLRETGMWVLLTSRKADVVRKAGGKPVVVGRLLEADAEWVLRRASELPSDEPSPVGASDLLELCGRAALDLAFVGRWSTVRGSRDPMAWRDAAESIRADLQNLELTREGENTAVGVTVKGRPLLIRQQSTASCSTVDDGAAPVSVLGSDASSPRPSSCSVASRALQAARENRRKAILRAGFRELVTGTGDDRVRLLYLSLGVLPDGHDFTAKDAVVLLRESPADQGTGGGEGAVTRAAGAAGGAEWVQKGGAEERAARKALRTLEAWSILAATGRRRGGKSTSYRMHAAHSSFAREILLECHEVLKAAVRRWVGFISSLDAVLFFEPLVLSRLWSAVEDVGGKGWRELLPYEAALRSTDNRDPLCRVCLVAVAKFRGVEGDFEGASAMWRRLLAVEQRAQTPNVLYPLWELVTAAEKKGKPEEAAEWRQYGYETLNLAMVKSTMMSPLETDVDGDGGGYDAGGSTGVAPKGTTDTASVIQSLSLNVVRFGPSQGAEAEMMLRRALEIEVARRGPDDMRVAAVLERLGVCVRQSGRLKEAEQLLRRALKIAETKLGEEDVLVARTVFHLGVCLRLAGRLQDAEELLWRSLDVETAKRGPDNVNVADTLHELGLCARLSSEPPPRKGGGSSRHRLEESTALFAHALEIREARLGPDDPAVGTTLHELGVCLRQDGRHEEAEAFLRRALGIRRAIAQRLGRGRKGSSAACGAAAVADAGVDAGVAAAATTTKYSSNNSTNDRGNGGRSIRNYNSNSSSATNNNSSISAEDSVVYTLFQLGVCVLQRGRRLEEAEAMLRSVLDIEKDRLGSGDVSVARVAFHLGVCLRRAGRRQEAERVLSGCVETLKDKLGEDNEEVATAQEVLDACAATE